MGGEGAMCCLDYLTTNLQDTVIISVSSYSGHHPQVAHISSSGINIIHLYSESVSPLVIGKS